MAPVPEVQQEREAVASRTVVQIAVVVVVVTVLAVVGQRYLLDRNGVAIHGPPPALRRASTEAPRVIGVVEQTLADGEDDGLARKRKDELLLHQYAWVDRAHGVARIPIDRAISLYVAREAHDAGAP
jgi:hypothetical protein